MPAPATSAEFLDLVRKSGVVDEKRLDAYLRKVPVAKLPPEPARLAGLLVRDGILTQFQAEQFLQGKWRRFTIGKYKVLERIGSGGMGSVYLCEHKFMRRRVAVKILPTAKASDPSALQRFYREARAVAALDHPNIVRAYDIDQEDNLHFLVMEYVDGSSLQDVVKKSGPLDPLRAAHYISQGAQGLQHAHEVAGLVHRDIKPGNLIVDRTGTVKILDMGLARFFNDEEDLLTQKYDENVLGTADYLAPEQALDSHGVDIRADIYSLGATFYFCLTGRTPFSEGTVAQKLIWHQTRQPKPIRSFRSDVPEGMLAVIDKMMTKDPEQRYQTPLEVVEALAPWTGGIIPTPSESEMPRLSPAAAGTATGDGGPAPVTPPPSKPPSSKTRRTWQVPGTAAPPTPASENRPPRPPRAQVDPASPFGGIAPPPGGNGFRVRPAEPASEEDGVVWEKLTADTQVAATQTDTDPNSAKKNSSGRLSPSEVARRTEYERRRLRWVLGIASAVALLLILLAVGWTFHDDSTPRPVGEDVTPTRLVVGGSDSEKGLGSVEEALKRVARFRAGRSRHPITIVIAGDIEEQLDFDFKDLGLRDLSIEPEEGREVVWRYPSKKSGTYHAHQLLFLNNAAGVTVRGLTFDGGNQVNQILLLAGECAGFRLENVSLRGFQQRAILVTNCTGRDDRKVVLSGIRTETQTPKEAAITFDLWDHLLPKRTQYITVEDCQFQGPYKSPIQVASKPDIKDLDLPADLVRSTPPPAKQSVHK